MSSPAPNNLVSPTEENLKLAAEAIRSGDLVIFPTETVYGIGANALDPDAVQKIFDAKGRPASNPVIVHVHSVEQIERIATIPDRKLLLKLTKFWPGPLSIVLPKLDCVPSNLTAGMDSVAVRVPAHPVAHKLLELSDCPIAAPSANRSNYVSPTAANYVAKPLRRKATLTLDGGICRVGLESTVLSLLDETPTLLRPGGITLEELQEVIGDVRIAEREEAKSLSPGMLKKHYSPKTKVALRDSIEASKVRGRVGVIQFGKNRFDSLSTKPAVQVTLSAEENLNEVGTKLFASLHDLDKLGLDIILVDTCEQVGLGRAIMDRLKRAAND